MGGKGSGNEGRKKLGNKFYNLMCRHSKKENAENVVIQNEKLGIVSKVVKENRPEWDPIEGYKNVMGYSVYHHIKLRRTPKEIRDADRSGSKRGYAGEI